MSHNLDHHELMQKIASGLDKKLHLIRLPRFLSSFIGGFAGIAELFTPKHSGFSKEGIIKGFKYRYFSNEKTKRDLNWEPKYSIEETVGDTIKWLTRHCEEAQPTKQTRSFDWIASPAARNDEARNDAVFITGANGFFGQYLTRELVARGYDVTILTRDIPRSERLFDGLNIKMIQGCLNQPETLNIPQNAHIFHVAGITGSVRVSQKEYYRVNVTGTENLLNAALKSQAQSFNFVSSVSAVGAQGRAGAPITENTQPNPKTYYGKSKLAAEKLLFASDGNMPITIIRPPLIYGEGQSDRSGSAMIFKLCQQKIIPKIGARDSILSMVHAQNLAAGFIDLAFKNTGKQIFNLADPVPYTFPLIAQGFGSARVIALPYLLGAIFGYSADAIAWLARRDIGLCSELIDNLARSGSHMSIEKAKEWGYKPVSNSLP